MDSCSKHPDPAINKNGYHKLSVTRTRKGTKDQENCTQGWDRAGQDRPGKTSSNRDICSTMGQEKKGHVIFTEHKMNTVRGKKNIPVLFPVN